MKTLRSLCLLAGLVLIASAAYAHHSVAAEFDPDMTVMAKGILSKVDWINPHTYFSFDVKQPDGKVITIESRSTSVSLPWPIPRAWFYSIPIMVSCLSMMATCVYFVIVELRAIAGRAPARDARNIMGAAAPALPL